MNLNQLKLLYLVAKRGSPNVAAKELSITQPAVTKGIQRLEEHYDIKFINYFGRRNALTDVGKALYGIAEKIFELERKANETVCEFQQRKMGHVKIHTTESFGAYYLPSIISPFKKSNPHIQVTVDILPTKQVGENTIELNNNLGFVSYPIEDKRLINRKVLEDRLVLISNPSHPFTRKNYIEAKDLEGESIIMHDKGSGTQIAIDKFIRKNNLSVFIPLVLSNAESIKRMVEQGLGVSIISQKVVSEEIQMGKLEAIPLSDPSMKRKFYMIHHRDRYISESLQSLIEIVYRWASEYIKGLA
ncbi:MAG: LysR family transcriptional regulator [Desulfobacterales bacterium]|nr:LysR family transcriptional regulator [Desulfobacterales bacterium]